MKSKLTCTLCGTALFLATGVFAQAAPGLNETRLGGQYVYANPLPAPNPSRVIPGPYGLNAIGDDTSGWDVNYVVPGIWPPPDGGWHNYTTFIYSGYIRIPEGSNTVTFAISFDDRKRLFIDDVEICGTGEWNITAIGTAELKTGWHKFYLIADNGFGGFGPNDWSDNSKGFGMRWGGWSNNPDDFFFPVDPGDGSLFLSGTPSGFVSVTTLGAANITATGADLSGSVEIAAGDSGVLRVYYGPADAGASTSGWAASADYPGLVTVAGEPHVITVSGLATGVQCFYRFAFSNALGVTLAPNTRVFVPLAHDTPARFGWVGDATPIDWNDASGWKNLDNLSRPIPNVRGDTIYTTEDPKRPRTFTLTNDVSVAAIHSGFGGNNDGAGSDIIFTNGDPETPVTLHLETLDGAPALVEIAQLGAFQLGAYANARDGLLTVQLHQPVTFRKIYAYGHYIHLNASLANDFAGGPCPVTFADAGNEWSGLVVVPRGVHTFTGDIFIGTPGTRAVRFYLGSNAWGAIEPPDDRLLGNPANRLVLRNNSYIHINRPGDDFLFQRTLCGSGTLRCGEMENHFNDGSDDFRTLNIGPAARFEPGEDNAFGNLSFTAATLNFDPDTTFRIKIDASTSDTLTFLLRPNRFNNGWPNYDYYEPEPGTLNLAGRVEFAQTNPAQHIAAGTRWVIGTTAYTNTTVNGIFMSNTPGVIIRKTQLSSGAWEITAEKTNPLTIFMMR